LTKNYPTVIHPNALEKRLKDKGNDFLF